MRILVIEDNPDIVANLYGFLEPKGYTLASERNGMSQLIDRRLERPADHVLERYWR